MEAFLGVRFLATEYSTGLQRCGRTDPLGLDENGCRGRHHREAAEALRRLSPSEEFRLQHVFLTLKLDPAMVTLEPGFSRDVRKIGL